MTVEDLEAALAPVREYRRSKELNPNTVLAAHMRAIGITPNGPAWSRAKEALGGGATFAEAARIGAGHTDEHTAPVHAEDADDRQSADSVAVITRATELTPRRRSSEPMDWYPQRFDPGAIQGDGAKKLLGSPRVSLEDMLVRETAQNSWDARVGGRPVDFAMNLRTLPPETTEALRDQVFTGDASGTGIRRALTDDMWVIEISDRGTVGLGGPVRNDIAVPPGSVTHFIDLVFNIGSTKADGASGGTYGFGKSIAYMVSEIGAVLIWSRCETNQGTEHRLIASAIGDVFEMDGYRYTGRHWWGRTIDGRPEPLTGDVAEALGQKLFSKGFDGDELGTSIMILAPNVGEPGPEDDAEILANSVLWNLWPKLLPDSSGALPMTVRVQVDGEDRAIPDPATHPVLSGNVACLNAVRAVQEGNEPPVALFSPTVVSIERYSKPVGHLALVKYPEGSYRSATETDERFPSRSVTLMRHGAELVVKQLERAQLSAPGFQWAGVFKPIAELDATFAQSEPPAHDDWSPASLPDKLQRSQVKVAMEKIKAAADTFIAGVSESPRASSDVPVAAVGDMLAGLLGGALGSAPSRGQSVSSGSRSARATTRARPVEWQAASLPGWTRTKVQIEVRGGPPDGSLIRAVPRVGVDGSTERSEQPEFVRAAVWVDEPYDSDVALVRPDEPRFVWFEARDDVAVDLTALVITEDS